MLVGVARHPRRLLWICAELGKGGLQRRVWSVRPIRTPRTAGSRGFYPGASGLAATELLFPHMTVRWSGKSTEGSFTAEEEGGPEVNKYPGLPGSSWGRSQNGLRKRR